jgi:hypothetical protein
MEQKAKIIYVIVIHPNSRPPQIKNGQNASNCILKVLIERTDYLTTCRSQGENMVLGRDIEI